MTSDVPAALTLVVERRYLAPFELPRWRLAPADEDPAVPVLLEVTALSRPTHEEELVRAMPHVLAACHNPGHDLVMALMGEGQRHRLYFGLRRRAGGGSSESATQGLVGAFRAQVPGLELGAPAPMSPTGHTALSSFLESAPCLASITGIPSARGGALPTTQQGLDRLTAALGTRRYALLVVAEPMPVTVVDEAMASVRRLLEELHPRIMSTLNSSQSKTDTETEQTGMAQQRNLLLRYAPDIAEIMTYAGMLGPIGPMLSLSAAIFDLSTPNQPTRSTTTAHAEQMQTGESTTLLDADARYCTGVLERHHERLAGARGSGWWRTAVYVAAEDEGTLHSVVQTVRSVAAGDATALEPLRVQRPPAHVLREVMQRAGLITMQPAAGGHGHPLGPTHEALATCISSDELAVLVQPPRREIPGLIVKDRGDFALAAPAAGASAVHLGHLRDADGARLGPVDVSARALNEHVLVMGTPGSGKTNTCMRLLLEAHDRLGVPFLVIEPVKGEYARLAGSPRLRGALRVYSVGGTDGLPLRLNPLRPVPGTPLLGHIDLLKAVFNASFAMYPGMPQILEQALIDVYEERGWNLYTGRNKALGARSTPEDRDVLMPCLSDLHRQVEVVTRRRGYGQEVHKNMIAALQGRLEGLMVGTKGLTLNTRRSTPLAELFDVPAVLDLQYLRDDEEKSFVMALVLALLSQYCEARQADTPFEAQERLQHVTLIEEAHRLLSAVPRANADTADARGKGVSMFTDMLAELRAKGEGFIVAEQIPTKLAPDVLKNTNLKIIHKLSAPADRAAVGESVNLSESQRRHLAILPKGVAVVHGLSADTGETIAEATLVEVDLVKDALRTAAALAPAVSRASLFRIGGCASCSAPCEFYPDLERTLRAARGTPEFRAVVEAALAGDRPRADEAWRQWSLVSGGDGLTAGHLHCEFVYAADAWLDVVLTARGDREGGGAPVCRPRDRLTADRLGAAFGRYARARLAGDGANDGTDGGFGALHELLRGSLEDPAAAPRLPACEACPVRCRMLPYVATRIGPALASRFVEAFPKSGTDRFGNAGALDARWHTVERVFASVGDVALAGDEATGFRYCLMAQVPLPADLESVRAEALAKLR